MSSNFIEIAKISCIILPILFGLHKVYRILIEKKYPTIMLYQPEQGRAEVRLFRLGKFGGMRYDDYDFWEGDGVGKLYQPQELLGVLILTVFIGHVVSFLLDSDLHTMKILMFGFAAVIDLGIFAFAATGRHQAYIALRKYIRNKDAQQEQMPEMGVVYDTKPAEDMCMAGLDREGMMAHFPLLPKEEIWRIYRESVVKKFDRYQGKRTTAAVILVMTIGVVIAGFAITKQPLVAGGGVLFLLVEGIIMGICGVESCPYCGKGRRSGEDYCWNCKGAMTKRAIILFKQENFETPADQTLQDL